MYLWLGIDLDSQLKELRNKVCEVKKQVGLPLDNPSFPMHLSLKISFEVADDLCQRVTGELERYFQTLAPFDFFVEQIELHPNICWVRYAQNDTLEGISKYLNDYLLTSYGVPLHEYDTDFKYHTTLFIDDDETKVATAHKLLGEVAFPKKLVANTFCIGFSPTGAFYTFTVQKRIVAS